MPTLRALVPRWFDIGTEPWRLRRRASIAGRRLSVRWRSPSLDGSDLVLVSVMKNDADRLRFWMSYYRQRGVSEFIIVDNDSDDGTEQLLSGEPGVTLIGARGSYRQARFGVDWVNAVARRYCIEKWVLWVDTDEFLAFDGDDRHDLPHLVARMHELQIESLQCILIDLYSSGAVRDNVVPPGSDPFAVCNLYDADGYHRGREARTRTTWIKGGIRARRFFDDPWSAPALNKTPLVRWEPPSMFVYGTHRLRPHRLNEASLRHGLMGALLHQRFLALSGEKTADAAHVAQHVSEYREYGDFRSAADFVSERTHVFRTTADLANDALISSARLW